MAKNYINLQHSFQTLVKDIVIKGVDKCLLVIAGDIFENKTTLLSDDIHLFKNMLEQLSNARIKTLIIPGNHDINMNSTLQKDNISLLCYNFLKPKNDENLIQCFNKTEKINGEIFGDPEIEFYIHSVVDNTLFTPTKDNKIKIAIIHDQVNGARYDNNRIIKSANFSLSYLKKFDIALLGDIHKPQFLLPNAAYSGSFVQKTKLEGIDHGYILWNVREKTGKHVFIPLKEVYIRLFATDNKKYTMPDVLEWQEIRYINFIYQNCTPDWLAAQSQIIKQKYGREPDNVICNNKFTDSNLEIPENINETLLQENKAANQHDELIKDILRGEDENCVNDIIDIHNKKIVSIVDSNYSSYKINFLWWNNAFCYGEDNFIDFTDLDKTLVTLNGPNRVGKSSIIDILSFALFGKYIRGTKTANIVSNQLSTGQKCRIAVSLQINDSTYIIDKEIKLKEDQETSTLIRIFKDGINITCENAAKTKQMIKDIIGDEKTFNFLVSASQDRKSLAEIYSEDFRKFIYKSLNVDKLNDLYTEVQQELMVDNTKIKIYQQKLEKLNNVNADQLEEASQSIQQYTQKIKLLKEKINTLTLEKDSLLRNKISVIQYKNLKCQTIEEINIAIAKIQSNSDKNLEINVRDLQKRLAVLDHELKDYSELDIAEISTEFDNNTLITNSQVDIQKLQEQKIILHQSIDLIDEKLPKTILSAEQLNYYLDNLQKYKHLSEEHQYIDYGNQEISQDQYQQSLIIVDEYEKIHKIDIASINSFTELLIQTLHKRSSNPAVIQKITKLIKDTQQLIITKQSDNTNAQAYKIAKQNTVKFQYQLFLQAETQVKWHKNTEILLKLEEINNVLDNYNKYQLYKKIKERYEIDNLLVKAESNDIEQLLQYRDAQTHNIKIEQQVSELEQQLANLNTKITKYRVNYTNAVISKSLIEKNLQEKQQTEQEFIDLQKIVFKKNLYKKVLDSKTGIPNRILIQTFNTITSKANEILGMVTNFNIIIKHYDKVNSNFELFVKDGDKEIPGALASGFQKFVIDLAIRLTFMQVIKISNPKIMFIDEGFGCLDRENFHQLTLLIPKLKQIINTIIIITHNDELKYCTEKIITISKQNKLSRLQQGKVPEIVYNMDKIKQIKESLSQQNASDKIEKQNPPKSDLLSDKYDKDLLFSYNSKEVKPYTCKVCKDSFKNYQSHMNAKTYFAKHVKFLVTNQ